MRRRPVTAALLLALALALGGCGGGSDPEPAGDDPDSTSTSDGAAFPTTPATDAVAEILGADSLFVAEGGGAEPIEVGLDARTCVLTDALSGSCRAGSGAGGDFVVTAEGTLDSPGDWNVVVRCGLQPALPAASAQGTFTPVIADLGLAGYGEVIGVTLLDGASSEAALVYQPEGSACPVVWGLGPVDPGSFFTGGTDALNGSESSIAFRDAQGADACAVPDGEGGITVGQPKGDRCS